MTDPVTSLMVVLRQLFQTIFQLRHLLHTFLVMISLASPILSNTSSILSHLDCEQFLKNDNIMNFNKQMSINTMNCIKT